MFWIQLLAYDAFCTLAVIVVLEIFAWSLRIVAKLPRPLPLLIGLIFYGIVAFCLVIPLLGLERINWSQGDASELFRAIALIGYLLSLLIAILFFRRRHLATLKTLGYFQSRSQY
jgi:hypothetical protein